MFCPAGNHQAVRIDGNELDHIANAVSPEPGIITYDQRIILSRPYVPERKPGRPFLAYFGCRDEFEKDPAVRVQQQPLLVPRILEREETFRSGIGFDRVDSLPDAVKKPVLIGLEIDAAVYEDRKGRENILHGHFF